MPITFLEWHFFRKYDLNIIDQPPTELLKYVSKYICIVLDIWTPLLWIQLEIKTIKKLGHCTLSFELFVDSDRGTIGNLTSINNLIKMDN